MFTIANGIILKGENLTPSRENIVVDDGKIIEQGRHEELLGRNGPYRELFYSQFDVSDS